METPDAITGRFSVRQFTDTPVEAETLRGLLELASRAPSGGNVQPWWIDVIHGPSMARFREFLAEREMEAAGYEIYPADLWEPHRGTRFEVGMQLYESLGIARDDKAARFGQMLRNYTFFDAPAAVFCFVDRRMGPPQWSDLGMFLQTFMVAATDAGLGTCAQEAWATYSGAVAEFCGRGDDLMLFCGVAVGHVDEAAPVNGWRSTRRPVEEFAVFH